MSPGLTPALTSAAPRCNRSHPSRSLASLQRPAQQSRALDVTNRTIKNQKIQRKLVSNVSPAAPATAITQSQQEEAGPHAPSPEQPQHPFTPTTTAKISPKHPVHAPETSRCTYRTQACPGPGRCCSPRLSRAGQGHFPELDSCFGIQLFYWSPNTRDPPAAAAAPHCPLPVRGPVPCPPAGATAPLGPTTAPYPGLHCDPWGAPGDPGYVLSPPAPPEPSPAGIPPFTWLSSRDSPGLGAPPTVKPGPPCKLSPSRRPPGPPSPELPRPLRCPPALTSAPAPSAAPPPPCPRPCRPGALPQGGRGAGKGEPHRGRGGTPPGKPRSCSAGARSPSPRGLGRLRGLLRAPASSGTGGPGRAGAGGSHCPARLCKAPCSARSPQDNQSAPGGAARVRGPGPPEPPRTQEASNHTKSHSSKVMFWP